MDEVGDNEPAAAGHSKAHVRRLSEFGSFSGEENSASCIRRHVDCAAVRLPESRSSAFEIPTCLCERHQNRNASVAVSVLAKRVDVLVLRKVSFFRTVNDHEGGLTNARFGNHLQ